MTVSQSEHVLALDPGGRSGYASAYMSVDKLELWASGVLPQKDMAGWLYHSQMVEGERHYDVIVCESWRPRRRGGSMDWIEGSPLIYAQHVGQIRLIATLSHAKYKEQEPSDKYNPQTKEVPPASYPAVMQDVDNYSTEQHDQDARYHLWVYFFRNWFTGQRPPDDCVALAHVTS